MSRTGEVCAGYYAIRAIPDLVQFAQSKLALPQPHKQRLMVGQLHELVQAGFTPRQIAVALDVAEVWVERWLVLRRRYTAPQDGRVYVRLQRLRAIAHRRRQAGYPANSTALWWEAIQTNLGGRSPRQMFATDHRAIERSIASPAHLLVRQQGRREDPPRRHFVSSQRRAYWS